MSYRDSSYWGLPITGHVSYRLKFLYTDTDTTPTSIILEIPEELHSLADAFAAPFVLEAKDTVYRTLGEVRTYENE